MRYLHMEEIIYLYTEMIRRTGGTAGLQDENALEEILNKPMVAFEGEDLYPDVFTKVAVLLYAMINNKPFQDGNKRIAVLAALFSLRINGYHVIAAQDKIIDMVKDVAAGRSKVDHLVTWFKKNTLPV
ncbi:type II toxin-antitoxin system death-on-curing family toxin [Azotosporobacter soli]|uniref:type II toxin-antitoxin system death-on-curing family toxin n=1 Tax=Azotosporobacter soli TaxID=3055040 RepID=UPI0031FECC04